MVKSKRLLIQHVTEADFTSLDRLLRDQGICQAAHLILPTDSSARRFALRFLISSLTFYKLCLKRQPTKIVGLVMFDSSAGDGSQENNVVEIGYLLMRTLWGQGLMTEALRVLLPVISTKRVIAQTVDTNLASQRVLLKCGFHHLRSSDHQIIWGYQNLPLH